MLNLDPKMFEAMKGHVPAMAAGAQASTNPLQGLQMPTQGAGNPLPAPQPKAASPNPLGEVFSSFARGFAPQQTQAVDDRRKAEAQERGKKALTWMQQTAALPAEQRAAFTLQSAQDIARDTGQSYEAVVASAKDPNAFSDQALNGAMAKFSAQLGISPVTPEPPRFQGMGLGDGGVGVLNQSTGRMEVVREPTVAPPKAPDPVKMEQYIDAEGQVWDRNPYTGESRKANVPRARVPGEGSGSNGEPSAYQLWQMQRAEKEDGVKERERGLAEQTAVSNLKDGQQRVSDLMGHKGFDGIYGPFGAFGVNMGAKPTNVMNQDELNAMALLDQVGGEAFLAGVQKMRGTGPLSDNEGKRVSAAVTRLTNRLQSPEAARAAAVEFSDAMKALERAYAQESGGAEMPDEVESSGIFDDVAEGASNAFGGVMDFFTGGTRNQPTRVNSKAERDALPAGTRYIAPDGSVKVKK
jgi:hypothetical protein